MKSILLSVLKISWRWSVLAALVLAIARPSGWQGQLLAGTALAPVTSIQITAPLSGDVFPVGAAIPLKAVAVDLAGAITRLDFFADGNRVGTSNIQFFRAPDPGTPIQHEISWSGAIPGEHVLYASGMDSKGAELFSQKVVIKVNTDAKVLPVVTTRALEPETSEISPTIRVKPAVIGFNRSGDAREPLRVWVDFGGTATYGKDYEALPQWVEFAAGEISTQLTISGTDDDLVERSETVVVRLGIPPLGAAPTYTVDPVYHTARVIIHDSDGGARLPIVSVSATQSTTSEPCPVCRVTPGVFTVSRTGDTEKPLTVFYALSGSAVNGVDYESLGSSVEIPVGQTSVGIEVHARMDDAREPVESVVVELLPSPASGPIEPYLVDGDANTAKLVIQDQPDQPVGAVVKIVSPKFGERFINPAAVEFVASTVDPLGAMTHLDWFANGEKIGGSDVFFIRAPDPGVPVAHEFFWKQPKPGSYKISAVGLDASGARVESEAILVEVQDRGIVPPGESDRVELDIVESDSVTRESDESGQVDVGVLKIRRSAGPRDVAVTVFYEVTGSAIEGVDFVSLPKSVVLPAGEDSVPLVITPISDKILEGTESVIVTLSLPACPKIFPPPPDCYTLGRSSSARVILLGENVGGGKLPDVQLLAPRHGAVFEKGKSIQIQASSTSLVGKVMLVELFVDGKWVAATKESALTFDWPDAGPGPHTILARATDDQGSESTSSPVEIFVRDASLNEVVFVDRGQSTPEIQKIQRASSGKIQLQIGGPKSQLVSIEVSEDLNKWFQLDPALVPSDGVLSVEDQPEVKAQSRFYRVKLLPMQP